MAFTPFTEQDMPTMANFNSKFQSAIDDAVQKAVASGVKIQTGSYTGTGTYGQSNPCSLTFDFVFDFVPKLLFFFGTSKSSMVSYGDTGYPLVILWNVTETFGYSLQFTDKYSNISYSGKTISWYSMGDEGQFNHKGGIFRYVAIG